MNDVELIAKKLKIIISTNGHSYLEKHPYEVYEELIKDKRIKHKTASALLCLMTNEFFTKIRYIKKDEAYVSQKIIEDGGFNEAMANQLAKILIGLFSDENIAEWNQLKMKGYEDFLKKTTKFVWNGFSRWHYSDGSVCCYYDAEIKIKPKDPFQLESILRDKLKENPFLSKKEIADFYIKKCIEALDDSFEEYCTCDNYYQPCVEDYEIEYLLETWCDFYNFKLVSCDGSGYDEGYEPDITEGYF